MDIIDRKISLEIKLFQQQKIKKTSTKKHIVRHFVRYVLIAFIICPHFIQKAQAFSLNFTEQSYTVNESAGSASVGINFSISSDELLLLVDDIQNPDFGPGDFATITINFSTFDETAISNEDYTSTTQAVSFTQSLTAENINSGNFGFQGTETINIPILNDSLTESDETIRLQIVNVTITTSDFGLLSQGEVERILNTANPLQLESQLIINDDDNTAFTVNLEPASSTITDQNVTINLIFPEPLSRAIVLNYQTVDDTAIAGQDYVAKSESLSLASGTSNVSIVVELLSSAIRDGRQFLLNFSTADGDVQINPNLLAVTLGNRTVVNPDAPGLNPTERIVAVALVESCSNTQSQALQQRCAEIINLSATDQATAIAALIQDETAGIVTQALDIGSAQFTNINGRISALKSGDQNIVSFNGFSLNIEGEAVSLGNIAQGLLNSASGGNAGDNIVDSERLGFFMSGNISFGNKDTTTKQSGFDFDSQGVTLGMDYRFTNQFFAGVALGYAFTNTDFDVKGGTESHAGSINLYGSYFLPQDIYVDMVGHFGYHASENLRSIRYSGFSGQASSDTDGVEYGFNISLGKQWDFNSWKFNPYARFEYLEVVINKYRESSLSGFAVEINQVDGRSLKSVLGTQIGKVFGFSFGVIQPSIKFEWLHQFEDNASNISGRFVEAAPGTGQFTLDSDSPDLDFFNLGSSVVATFAEGRSIYFNHESRLGQRGINSYRFELGVRIPF